MPIAKKTLRVGSIVYATAGAQVSQEAVKENGWEKDVEPDRTGGKASEDESSGSKKK